MEVWCGVEYPVTKQESGITFHVSTRDKQTRRSNLPSRVTAHLAENHSQASYTEGSTPQVQVSLPTHLPAKKKKPISSLNPDTIVLYGFQQRGLLFSVWIRACICTNVYNDTQIIVDIFKLVDQPLNLVHSCIHSPLFC